MKGKEKKNVFSELSHTCGEDALEERVRKPGVPEMVYSHSGQQAASEPEGQKSQKGNAGTF